MNIHQATREYELWMRSRIQLVNSHLRSKHENMQSDPFMFFRGTFYRWAQIWPELCKDLRGAPTVLCSGDLHVGSFGTWRDLEGRLCWGVDDFDEAYPLPYTNDLTRLAASVKIVTDSETLSIKLRKGCDAIIDGYRQSLAEGGCPIVLAEHERAIEKLGIDEIKPPKQFWEKLVKGPEVKRGLPKGAKQALENTLPDANVDYKIVQREAGMGSLGQPRFVAIAEWKGGYIAREAKETIPSSCAWVDQKKTGNQEIYYETAIKNAVRSHDPYQKAIGSWIVRRLSPDSNRIDIDDLPAKRDEEILLHAMGSEAANVHLGTKHQTRNILKDLDRRKADWLRSAAKEMAKAIERDWKDYKKK